MNEALIAAFAAEHAAIFGYGPVGVRLADRAAEEARAAEAAHRARRDHLVVRLAELAATTPPAPAGYTLPFPVGDRAAALRLAVHLEERCAGVWRAALPATDGIDRRTALDALTDCAVRATRWRRLAGVSPLTVPFPGRS